LKQVSSRGVAALLLTGLLLVLPTVALAHQRLLATDPARDSVATSVPRELRLRFYEPVELAFTSVALIGPDGVGVALGTPRLEADSATVIIVPVTGVIQAGEYTVQWATASRDGHPVRATFSFTVAPDAAGLPHTTPAGGEYGASVRAPGQPQLPAEHHIPVAPHSYSAESLSYVLVRWANYIALMGVIGAVAFRVLVLTTLRRRRADGHEPLAGVAARKATQVGALFAGLLLIAGLGRLYAQSLAMHGPEHVLSMDRLLLMLLRTVWGWGWLLQMGAALLALLAFTLATRRDVARAGGVWSVAVIAALLIAVTPALSGHAAAMAGKAGTVAIVMDTLHVLAAGGWLGTLLLVLLAGVPAALREGNHSRGDEVAHLVRAFSPAAMLFAALLVTSGVVAVYLHSGSLAALLGSRYGTLLLIKLGVFCLVLAAGAWNYLKIQPALGPDSATMRLKRSAGLELGAAVLVLLVTAMLVATARPNGTDAIMEASPGGAVGNSDQLVLDQR
jgi:putative copper export protein/methionine-rich copper-binding protein CopC